MNIQISDNWLREFIETKASVEQIAEYLSLCSQSVEKIIKEKNDYVYDIEITTNRPDCLSVYGIARELAAVLPCFGLKAKLKDIPVTKISTILKGLPLEVEITKPDLCPRFTALVYDNVVIKPSPKFVQERLNQAGIRALNNVIDISNYLMLELGQPMHTFDYDKIKKNKMILRESKKGEEIVTLDGQKRVLDQGIMVIEDGEGRLVDLCGIMGAKNSETDENTKRVLLFVQTYSPMKIRKATQSLAFRTEAAARFEKGIDPEGVLPAMERATNLFNQWCSATPNSELFDLYPNPEKSKSVMVSKNKIDQVLGFDLDLKKAADILESLGFTTKIKQDQLESVVPHWRNNDIAIPEDLIEEIARIYGYHNLPNLLPPLTTLNYQPNSDFDWEKKIKHWLTGWGFTETSSYSMVGKNLISDPINNLKVANPLTDDLVYLRNSLIPSLLQVVAKNKTEKEIKIFEMANIYFPGEKNSLPQEIMSLTFCQTGENKYLLLKGILEALLNELGIENWQIKPDKCLTLDKYGLVTINGQTVGIIGEVKTQEKVCVIDLEIKKLLSFANKIKKYQPLPKYPPILEDFSLVFPSQTPVGPIIEAVKDSNEIVKSVELIDSYQDVHTLRITYQSLKSNLTESEVSKIREKILKKLESDFSINIKPA